MIDAMEVEVALEAAAEGGIGEVDVAVATHDEVVGRVQALPLEALGKHRRGTILGHADHSSLVALAGVEATLAVVGIAVGAATGFAIHRDTGTGHELQQSICRNVAEDQEAVARPRRALGEAKSVGDLLDGLDRKSVV